jgi:hypothetical protein
MTLATTATEISATTSALGAIGLLSMLVLRVALKFYDYDYLPVAMAARVRWWDRYHPALLAVSACLLLGGVLGMALD